MKRTRVIIPTNVRFVACQQTTSVVPSEAQILVVSDVVSSEIAEMFIENSSYHDPFEQVIDRRARKVTVFPHEIRGEYFIKPLLQRVSM